MATYQTTAADLVIEDNVPLPGEDGSQRSKTMIGVVDRLLVTQSVLLPTRISSASSIVRHLKPKRFVCRTTEGGTRVWRIA